MVHDKMCKGFLVVTMIVLTHSPFCDAEIDRRSERSKGGLFGSNWGFTPSKRCEYQDLTYSTILNKKSKQN